MIPFPDLVHPDGHTRTREELVTHHRLLEWDIRPGETVIVMGGFDGFTCALIHEMYPEAMIHTFEPQRPFYEALVARFRGNERVWAHPYGLGIESGFFPMSGLGGNEASFFEGVHNLPMTGVGELREWREVMHDLDIESLAWLHINAEQYEYVLLPHLIRTGWIKRIGQLVIQVHTPPSESLPWKATETKLRRTHQLLWEGMTWQAWGQPSRMWTDPAARLP